MCFGEFSSCWRRFWQADIPTLRCRPVGQYIGRGRGTVSVGLRRVWSEVRADTLARTHCQTACVCKIGVCWGRVLVRHASGACAALPCQGVAPGHGCIRAGGPSDTHTHHSTRRDSPCLCAGAERGERSAISLEIPLGTCVWVLIIWGRGRCRCVPHS